MHIPDSFVDLFSVLKIIYSLNVRLYLFKQLSFSQFVKHVLIIFWKCRFWVFSIDIIFSEIASYSESYITIVLG